MVDKRLTDYIEKAMASGVSEGDITAALLKYGWKKKEIEKALKVVKHTKNNLAWIFVASISIIFVIVLLFLFFNISISVKPKTLINQNTMKANSNHTVSYVCNDFECFISSAETCTPKSFRLNETVRVLSMTEHVQDELRIIGNADGKCNFSIKILNISLIPSQRLPKDFIIQEKKVLNSMIGRSGYCIFNKSDLVALLKQWSNGTMSTEDFSKGECTGSYFS